MEDFMEDFMGFLCGTYEWHILMGIFHPHRIFAPHPSSWAAVVFWGFPSYPGCANL
jgi:hypothetical protein